MPHHVGIDYAQLTSTICVLDDKGAVVDEAVVPSTVKDVTRFLRGKRRRYRTVGAEASSPAWFLDGLRKARLPLACLDPWHAHSILRTTRNKTDRNDARGIAEIVRVGAFKAVHLKSEQCRRIRLLLKARSLLQLKQRDIEASLKALLADCGACAGGVRTKAKGALKLGKSHAELQPLVDLLGQITIQIGKGVKAIESDLITAARLDPVCRRLMTAPGVGPLTALAFRAAIDDPRRFSRSRDVAAHFGLTPRTYQSGQRDTRGHISKCGDASVRKALFWAGVIIQRRNTRASGLKAWGESIAQRRGSRRAAVALARRLAVILHRMWLDETEFLWDAARPASAADVSTSAG
jgi:transposase